MKRFFSFFGKVAAFLAMAGVVLYCIGYFFTSKGRRVCDMFSGKCKDDPADDE